MNRQVSALAGVLAVIATFGFAGEASAAKAAKKVSLAQAWKICKAQIDKDLPPNEENQQERFLRGGACMKKLGYEL